MTGLCLAAPLLQAGESVVRWPGEVASLLDRQCVKCHGPLEQKSGLALDSAEAALKGGDDGAVVVPGKPEESPLIKALAAGADPHMPPKKQLEPAEVALLESWVKTLAEAPKPAAPAKPVAAVPTEPAAAVDHFLAEGWAARGVTPAAAADDLTFLRRVWLDLAGRVPTVEEADSFLAEAGPDKRTALVDRLLASEDYARHFREVWDVLLMGRRGGGRDKMRAERGWHGFLENAFAKNRPWNEVVRAMIEGRADNPEDKGAVVFLYERKNDHQRIAEAVAPVIYGTRVDCAQCHDHPLAREIKQGHYWGLVAAFNRSKNSEKGPPVVSESAVGGFVNFTNLKKESQPAVIAMLNGRTITETRPEEGSKVEDTPELYKPAAGEEKVPVFSRRGALAEAATVENPLLARSFVNHTWALLMGRGLVHPVDEMNSKHPPSHPEMLDWLAADFAAHHCDVRRLVRSIVLSRGYQLAAAAGTPPEAFAGAMEKPVIAETIARSARIVAGGSGDDEALRRGFAERFPDVLPRVTLVTTQQVMFLSNSPEVSALFAPAPGNAATQIAALPAAEDRVRAAFKRVLLRQPDAAELKESTAYLNAGTDPATAVSGLLWSLVSGPEFLTNH